MTFFDHVDNIASNYLLPLGGMLTAIFVGWVWGTNNAHIEIEKHIEDLSLQKALEELGFHTQQLDILGVYEADQFRFKSK